VRVFIKNKLLEYVFANMAADSIYSTEIKSVILLWVFVVQHKRFPDVLVAIEKRRKNCLQRQSGLKLDDMGILRCYGRYMNNSLSEDTKNPKLLPRHAVLLVREVYQRLVHTGVAHTLAQLREEYWIPQGRAQVRSLISKCVICQKYEGSSFQLPNMPPWPRERVSQSEPFQFIGLDYLGSMHVKFETELKKVWVC